MKIVHRIKHMFHVKLYLIFLLAFVFTFIEFSIDLDLNAILYDNFVNDFLNSTEPSSNRSIINAYRDLSTRMTYLFAYEYKRKGNFKFHPQNINNVKLYDETQLLVLVGKSFNPENDFSFNFNATIDNNKIGTFEFKYSDVCKKDAQYVTLKCKQNAKISITLICMISYPLSYPLTGRIEPNMPKYMAIGHRGCGTNFYQSTMLENTPRCCRKALNQGADMIEIDVQLSKDDTIIVMHDMLYETNEKPDSLLQYVRYRRRKYGYSWYQLPTDTFKKSANPKYKTERPTFVEMVSEMPNNTKFMIELKYTNICEKLKIPIAERNYYVDTMLNGFNTHLRNRELILQAFCPLITMMVATKQSRWPVYSLMRADCGQEFEAYLRSFAPVFRDLGIRGFNLASGEIFTNPELVTYLKNMGFEIVTYHSNNRQQLQQQLDYGVDGFVTDDMPACKDAIEYWLYQKNKNRK